MFLSGTAAWLLYDGGLQDGNGPRYLVCPNPGLYPNTNNDDMCDCIDAVEKVGKFIDMWESG